MINRTFVNLMPNENVVAETVRLRGPFLGAMIIDVALYGSKLAVLTVHAVNIFDIGELELLSCHLHDHSGVRGVHWIDEHHLLIDAPHPLIIDVIHGTQYALHSKTASCATVLPGSKNIVVGARGVLQLFDMSSIKAKSNIPLPLLNLTPRSLHALGESEVFVTFDTKFLSNLPPAPAMPRLAIAQRNRLKTVWKADWDENTLLPYGVTSGSEIAVLPSSRKFVVENMGHLAIFGADSYVVESTLGKVNHKIVAMTALEETNFISLVEERFEHQLKFHLLDRFAGKSIIHKDWPAPLCPVRALRASPDGCLVAVAGPDLVWLFSALDLRQLGVIRVRVASSRFLLARKDGLMVAPEPQKGTVLMNPNQLGSRQVIVRDLLGESVLDPENDDRIIYSSIGTRDIKKLDAATGEYLFKLKGGEARVTKMAIINGGKWLAVVDDNDLCVTWNMLTRRRLRLFRLTPGFRPAIVDKQEGLIAARVADEAHITLRRLSDGVSLFQLPGESMIAAAHCPSNNKLAAVDATQEFHLWTWGDWGAPSSVWLESDYSDLSVHPVLPIVAAFHQGESGSVAFVSTKKKAALLKTVEVDSDVWNVTWDTKRATAFTLSLDGAIEQIDLDIQ